MASSPVAVRLEVLQLLDEGGPEDRPVDRLRPSHRLRLLGLLVAAGRKLGELDRAEAAAAEGSRVVTSSTVANAEFLLQLGALRIVQNRPEDALYVVNGARLLTARELEKPEPSAKESRRRRRWIQATNAAAHVIRGEVFLNLSEGSMEGAFADALKALRQTANLVKASSHSRRVHLSAVTLLCALLVRFGTTAIVDESIQLLDEAERLLIYRCRLPPGHLHRIKIKWGRALAVARLGSLRKAEVLLLDVIDRLIAGGWKDDAKRALDALVWVVERTNMPARAGYYLLKYSG
ncbi:MAG: hypothetical protein GY719_02380 [bacterium]|nr:hypothetical protein [bacterium]